MAVAITSFVILKEFVVGQDFWIADDWNQRIQVFSTATFHFIRSISLGEFKPVAICLNLNGLIFVTTEQHVVLIINQEGNVVKTFGSPGGNLGQFNKLVGIACNTRNEILVADYGNHRIQVFSKDGQFLHKFGDKYEKANQLFGPIGIYIDKSDNVFVADFLDNKIDIFNSKGVLIQAITLYKPVHLCLVGKNLVAIGNYDSIKVFSN